MSLKVLLKEIKAFEETKDLKLNYHEIMTVYQYVKKKKAFNPNDPNELYEPVLKQILHESNMCHRKLIKKLLMREAK